MIRSSRIIFISFLLLSLFPQALSALEIPKKPSRYVTDQAGLMSVVSKQKLEQGLRAFEAQTSNQLLVVILESLEGEALEDYSIRLAEAWKVGQKDKDNGVIFLIFSKDRKMRIEVGYGLEGALPDGLAGQIINQIVVPFFKEGKYDEGIFAGAAAIIKATQQEYKSNNPYASGGAYHYQRPLTPEEMAALQEQGKVIGTLILILVGLFFVVDFFRYRGYLSNHRMYKNRYSFWEWWFRFAILLFVLSVLFRILFYAALFSRGGYYGGRSGFGGFRGGGGSFGGGGASGGW